MANSRRYLSYEHLRASVYYSQRAVYDRRAPRRRSSQPAASSSAATPSPSEPAAPRDAPVRGSELGITGPAPPAGPGVFGVSSSVPLTAPVDAPGAWLLVSGGDVAWPGGDSGACGLAGCSVGVVCGADTGVERGGRAVGAGGVVAAGVTSGGVAAGVPAGGVVAVAVLPGGTVAVAVPPGIVVDVGVSPGGAVAVGVSVRIGVAVGVAGGPQTATTAAATARSCRWPSTSRWVGT